VKKEIEVNEVMKVNVVKKVKEVAKDHVVKEENLAYHLYGKANGK